MPCTRVRTVFPVLNAFTIVVILIMISFVSHMTYANYVYLKHFQILFDIIHPGQVKLSFPQFIRD